MKKGLFVVIDGGGGNGGFVIRGGDGERIDVRIRIWSVGVWLVGALLHVACGHVLVQLLLRVVDKETKMRSWK